MPQTSSSPQIEHMMAEPKIPRLILECTVDGVRLHADSPIEVHSFDFESCEYHKPETWVTIAKSPEDFEAALARLHAEHKDDYAKAHKP